MGLTGAASVGSDDASTIHIKCARLAALDAALTGSSCPDGSLCAVKHA